jgi:hypothetical protein
MENNKNSRRQAVLDALNPKAWKKRRRERRAGSSTAPQAVDGSGAEQASTGQATEPDGGSPRPTASDSSPSDDEDGASDQEPLSVFILKSLAQPREGEHQRLRDERERLAQSFKNLEKELKELEPERQKIAFTNTELAQILDGTGTTPPGDQDVQADSPVWDWVMDKGIPLLRIAKAIGDLALEVHGLCMTPGTSPTWLTQWFRVPVWGPPSSLSAALLSCWMCVVLSCETARQAWESC